MFQIQSNLLRIHAPYRLFAERNEYSKDIFLVKSFTPSDDPEYTYSEW